MTGRRAIGLTARREISERLRSRAFKASTAVQVLIVVAIVIIAGLVSGQGAQTYTVGVVGPQAAATATAAERVQETFDAELDVTRYATPAAARTAVLDGDAEAAIVNRTLVVSSSSPQEVTALIQTAAQGRPPNPPLAQVDVGKGNAGGEGLAFIGVLLLYIAILTFGYVVASGVVEEKDSRIVEVILSTIKPVHLLAGKVLGIGVVGLAQLVLVVGIGAGLALGIGTLELPDSTGETLVLVIVCFALGYLFYGSAFAAAGSIVSRQEDVQSTTTPMLVILVAGYVATISVPPDGPAAQVMTFLPFTAPLILPSRAATGNLEVWELGVSLALLVLSTAVLIWLAARIYERAILRMGAPMKLSQALRLVR